MRFVKSIPLLLLAVYTSAVQATLLFYSAGGREIYSIDTTTGAQAPVMTLPDGVNVVSLATSPVADSLYALDLVEFTLSINYACIWLVDVKAHGQRLVGCGRLNAKHIAFDARHDTLYGGTTGIYRIDQRTGRQTAVTYFDGLGATRSDQGMALTYDMTSDTLYGSGVFSGTRGVYSIDPATAIPTRLGTAAYRAIFADPSSGVLYGISPAQGTSGTPELQTVDKANGTGSRIATLPENVTSIAAPPLATSPITLVEFYHASFDHYFVTGDPAEIAKLDSGAIAGWVRTGEQFPAFPLDAFGTANTCRFFSTAFAPKSSHFYAAHAQECAAVKAMPAWLFEGEVFAQVVAPPDGGCASGMQSIYRLYNNGQGGAPAHRYTVRDALRSAQIQRGWVPEGAGAGVVACVPPSGSVPDSAEGVWIGSSTNPVGGGIAAHESVSTVVLATRGIYQLYVEYNALNRARVAAIVQGTASASTGVLTSTGATVYQIPRPLGLGAGAVVATTLSAVYTPESTLTGSADPEHAFATAYQVGYRSPANPAAAAGTYRGALATMQIQAGQDFGSGATLVVGVNGALSGLVGDCTVQGSLAPHATDNVFDLNLSVGGVACTGSIASLRGVAYIDAATGTLTAIAVDDARIDAFGFTGIEQAL